MPLLHAIRYTELIRVDEESSKGAKATKKRTHNADCEVVDLTFDTAPPQSPEPTPKKRKTVSVVIPSTPAPVRRNSKDWGTAENIVNPNFSPRFEPLQHQPKNAAATGKATPKPNSRKGKEKAYTPPGEPTPKPRKGKEKAQTPPREPTPKPRKGKEKAHTLPREPTPPVRSLDELRQAGLIEDEGKLQALMDGMCI